MEDDAISGGEELSLSEAATRYAQATAPEEVQEDQTEDEIEDDSDPADEELQASDEEAGEDEDGETVEEDQAEDDSEDDDEPESEQGRFVASNARVKLDDGTIVSVEDLKKGSLLQADYTRKTQETAEQRRALEAQSESVTKAEQQLTEQRDYMAALLQSITPQAPDIKWSDPSSPDYDPVRYITAKAQFDQFSEHLNYITSQSQETQTKRQQEMQAKRVEKANTEWGHLLEKAPELKDRSKFTAFESELQKFAPDFGFTPQELMEAVPYDHRMALVLKDAIAMRKLRASKPKVDKKSEGRPPIHKGGKRLNPSAQKARQASDATKRLKSSGRIDDAVAAYLARK